MTVARLKTAMLGHLMTVLTGIAVSIFFSSSCLHAETNTHVLLGKDINFGEVTPFNNSVNMILDGLNSRVPACNPDNSCSVSGGHAGVIYFYNSENEIINIEYPDEVELKTKDGRVGGVLQRMHMYSDIQPISEGGKVKAYIGGEVRLHNLVYGERFSGTCKINIVITTK